MLVDRSSYQQKKMEKRYQPCKALPTVRLLNNLSTRPQQQKTLSGSENQAAGTTILIEVIVVAAAVGGYYYKPVVPISNGKDMLCIVVDSSGFSGRLIMLRS